MGKEKLGSLIFAVFISFAMGSDILANEISKTLTAPLSADLEQKQQQSEASENVLGCDDFQEVLKFVQEQHLRFTESSVQVQNSFIQTAEEGFSAALRALGYPMLAAYAEMKVIPTWAGKFSKLSSAQICDQLGNAMFRAAFLKSYARGLDPYSDFYVTDELSAKSSALEGEFIGVGIGTEVDGDDLRVTEVVESGPADGKLMVADRISRIDGHSVKNLTDTEIRQRIRGPQNSVVQFEGFRFLNGDSEKKENFLVSVTRNKVHQKSVSFAWMDNGVLSIRLSRFFRQTADEVADVVKKEGPKAKGFILDLRNNPGGLLQAARDVVDLFVSQGVVVYLKGKSFEDQIWALREGGELKKPLVILVNEGTASAAEIVAGALQDYGRAVVVGQKTYGKGSVQNIYETQTALGIHYKGGLKLTTLWYFLPSGKNVSTLQPDLLLAKNQEEIEKNKIDHPLMPYHGPDRIDVIPVQGMQTSKKVLDQMKASNLLDPKTSTEEVGRELLLKMLAVR